MQIIVVCAVLAVAAAAPQSYGAPSRGYGAPQPGALGTSQGPVYSSAGGAFGGQRSAAQSRDAQARTISEENIHPGDGTYQFSFQTDNGINREEQGNADQVTGSYSYTADDGQLISISFVADANGFQPQGDSLPTPVPTEYPTPDVPLTPEASPSQPFGGQVAFGGRGGVQTYSPPATPSRYYGASK